MKEPLTPEEVQAASDLFFPLFDIVNSQMPEDATITDTLDVMESVCKLAHQSRGCGGSANLPFGFNKKDDEDLEDEE
tara:strand:- start:400 stop:630 length:231 start_codon:yes stop_codon:yes gene_type:complete